LEETQKSRNIPGWAWVLGCLGLLAACAITVALGAAAFSILFVLSESQGEIGSIVAADETTALATEAAGPGTVEPADLTPTVPPAPEVQEAATSVPVPSAIPTEEASLPPAPTLGSSQDTQGDFEDPYAAERAAIEANVAAIRQLEPKEAVSPLSLAPEELRQRLEEDLLKDYGPEQGRQDAIAMSAFDFMPADLDLYGLVLDLLTEQIAGYYDPETDEFVIISNDPEFDILEQVTHAHEYVHALQDQYYNLELLDDDNLDSEAAFAIQALAEGDATFVQTQFMLGGYFEAPQLLELLEKSLAVDTAVLDSVPPVMARELEFPYLTGLEFVQALYAQGGYAAVDAAWNNLPQSTEHILHPQRYLNGDAPQLVSVAPLTDTLGAGWELVDEDTLGEFYLRQYLVQQLDDNAVDQAATGWGGDRYAVYWNEDQQVPVMVLKLRWDTADDAAEFDTLFPLYPEGLFGDSDPSPADGGRCWSGQDVICLFSSEDESLVVRAPDLETAARVAAIQQTNE